MIKNITETTKQDLSQLASSMMQRGYRFVTMTCVDLGDALDIMYHFDKDLELITFRLKLPKGEELPSISGVYLAAVVVENEIKDLFGLPVTGMALDFDGKFVLSENAPIAPQAKTPTPASPSAPLN
ncbi:MAG: NADH-quinone oxidoreductase subunit C [Planctomycetaceae bacterium]|nr:MAG: NADH-quinone oxidoreductase subunit C [Planctomycetaceae bacterium]